MGAVSKSYARTLAMIDAGEVELQASLALHRLMRQLKHEASARHGSAKGSITLKLDFDVSISGMVEVKPTISTKVPDRKVAKAIAFLDEDANVVMTDPRQQELPIREVPAPAPEVRDVGARDASAKEV